MKFAACSRFLCAALFPGWLCLATSAQALQVDIEEFKRLQGEVADLRDANAAYQKRLTELTRRIEKLQQDLREAHDRSALKMGDLVTREELKKVIDRIAEVDEKREGDRKVILEQFDKLEKTLMSALGGARSNGARSNRDRDPEPETKPVEPYVGDVIAYKVKPDESLSEIVEEYNLFLKKEGRPTIRLADVARANPKLNINRIFVGQTIQLPVPQKK